MPATIQVKIKCDECDATIDVAALLMSKKSASKLKVDLNSARNIPKDWYVDIDDEGRGYGSSSYRLVCHCPTHNHWLRR